MAGQRNPRARSVALLRGINVGGHHKVPMARLRAVFEALGCVDVETYIQSGNVVFGASSALVRALPAQLARALHEEFGFEVPVVTRSAAEFASIARSHPLAGVTDDPARLAVGFLAGRPRAAAVARLDPERSPRDAFEVRGREVYLAFPDGMARSKLTNTYFDATLGVLSTWRNWKSVQRIAALASA